MGVVSKQPTDVGVVCCGQSSSDQIDTELSQLLQLISELPSICTDPVGLERHFQKYSLRLDSYQEQPHLLEPIVAQLLAALLAHVDKFAAPPPLVHTTLKYVAHLVKVRGAKVLVRRFPHETDDVLIVLEYLERQKPDDCDHWDTRYVLLMWLSMLVMTPFAMTAFDDGHSTPITTRIFSAVEVYLGAVDKCQQASALVLAKFVTRPDMAVTHLPSFVDKLFERLSLPETPLSEQLGILQCLAGVYKHGRRSDLLPLAASSSARLLATPLARSMHVHARKLTLKLLHRIGLAFLPSHAAKWRYQRGKRSLAANLLTVHNSSKNISSSNSNTSDRVASPQHPLSNDIQNVPGFEPTIPGQSAIDSSAISVAAAESSSDFTVPEQIEDVIENVIVALKDPDTIVRWTAAKAVGRIAGRLSGVSEQLCDDIVDCVLEEAFRVGDCVSAWHGGCLALAELSRRGVLSLSRLPAIIPLLLRALSFDQVQGSYAVGAAVRDAACYVCWALARAFEPSVLRRHVLQIAPALLSVALFDREVGCRRAAAAAFQENVGRQGTFPHGISIITNVDYFTVGNRSACFTKLSVFVAGYVEYTRPLMGHLLEKKVCHWDVTIRELAAKALHNLTACDPSYARGYVCDVLQSGCGCSDLATRHGSILALGHVVLALSQINIDGVKVGPDVSPSLPSTYDVTTVGNSNDSIGGATAAFICSLHSLLHRRGALSGVGCELMYKALCCLIKCCCRAKMSHIDHNTLAGWRSILDVCLSHVDDSVRDSAVCAVPDFAITSIIHRHSPVTSRDTVNDPTRVTSPQASLLEHFLLSATVENQSQRRGYCLALGALPMCVVGGHVTRLIDALIGCCQITESTRAWAECRRDAAHALTRLCLTTGVDPEDNGDNGLSSSNIGKIFDCLLGCLDDYTLDRRGDIGAWVREAGLVGLQRLTILLAASDSERWHTKTSESGDSSRLPSPPDPLLNEVLVSRVAVAICQLTAEKIDRTRGVAGAALTALLTASPPVPHIPEYSALCRILQLSPDCNQIVPGEEGKEKSERGHDKPTDCSVLSNDIPGSNDNNTESSGCYGNTSSDSPGCYGNVSSSTTLRTPIVDWCQERAGLQCAGQLLALPVYHDHVLLTLLLAAGSVGERLATAAQQVICQHLSAAAAAGCDGTPARQAAALTLCPDPAQDNNTSPPTPPPTATTSDASENLNRPPTTPVAGDDSESSGVNLARARCSRFSRVFVRLWTTHLRQGRVTVALMRALPPILSSGVLDSMCSDTSLSADLFSLCRREISRCADVQKLLAGIDLLCALLEFWWTSQTEVSGKEKEVEDKKKKEGESAGSSTDTRQSILHTLTILLCHRYPRVRRATAQSLYESLLTAADDAEDEVEEGGVQWAEVQAMLADTEWAEELETVRPVRDRIRQTLRLAEPQPKSRN